MQNLAHSFVECGGAATLHRLNDLKNQGSLFLGAFFALLALHLEDVSPESTTERQYIQPFFGNLRNPAILKALLAELHAQAVSALPLITCLALTLGSIAVNLLLLLLTQLNAYDSIGQYLAPAMLRELAPLCCALVMLVRYAPTIVRGCGMLSLNHETTSLSNMGIDTAAYRHAPIYLAALIGTPLLALNSPASRQRTMFIFLFLACLIILLSACGAPRSDKAYSEPDQLKQAPLGRSSFVDSFLQGNWCESEALFATSQDNFLRQDMVCQAAYNYTLAWKLKQYVGLDDPERKRQAERFRRMGFDCPASTVQHPLASLLAPQTGQTAEEAISSGDTSYRHLLQTNDFAALKSSLEIDQIYASHYARKRLCRPMRQATLKLPTRFSA